MAAEEFLVEVPSSDGETNYSVIIVADDGELIVSCNCKAGALGKLCKHKVGVINANMCDTTVDVVQPKLNREGIGEMLRKSTLGGAFKKYMDAEAQLESAKNALDRAKKAIESAMRGTK